MTKGGRMTYAKLKDLIDSEGLISILDKELIREVSDEVIASYLKQAFSLLIDLNSIEGDLVEYLEGKICQKA